MIAEPSFVSGTTSAPGPVEESTSTLADTGDVDGFPTTTIEIDGGILEVAVADRGELRRRGLMDVEDLGRLDGMLFVMDGMAQSSFTMRNTRIPLHIAFFDEAGNLVDVLEMTPCDTEPCPLYQPDGAYRYAVEAPLGAFDELSPGARLSIEG